jgi:hypothetical protein
VFKPGLDDERFILDDYPPNFIELTRTESPIPSQNDWTQPKLRFVPLSTNVHVNGFSTIEAVKEEPVRSWDPVDARHDRSTSILSSSLAGAKPLQ